MHKIFYIFSLSLFTFYCDAITIQASSLDCSVPAVLNESAIIELDIPLEISGPDLCELITAGPGFGIGDTVTFIATNANNITLTSDTVLNNIGILTVQNPGIWDVRSFTHSTQRFIFQDIHITMQPGGSILADGVTFQLLGTSKITTQPIAEPI